MYGSGEKLKVLYLGSLEDGGTCGQRMRAISDLGHEVIGIDTTPRGHGPKLARRIAYRLFRYGIDSFGRLPDYTGVNSSIREAMNRDKYDLLWLDKGMNVEAQTFHAVKHANPQCVIVGYSPDDMGSRHGQSKQFLEHLPLYDIFFTTKTYNVAELEAMGCPRVEFIANAFDPYTHRPWALSSEERRTLGGPVGFLGTPEAERAEHLYRLAARGTPIRVWGQGWHQMNRRHPNIKFEEKLLWGENYAKALSAFDINLCFLRKVNRDLQTTRSIEIPACGKFMLAERTDEHLALFDEGKEAEFFEGDDELWSKVQFYLAHPAMREQIAAAGRLRCERSGYSNQERLKLAFRRVETVRAEIASP